MAHVGLQPQKFSSSSKFKIYGRKDDDLKNILNDCINLEKAGAISLLLEECFKNCKANSYYIKNSYNRNRCFRVL